MEDQYIQFAEFVCTPDGTIHRLPHSILDRIKGAVALEYSAEGLSVLVEHSDQFEWMDISYCIPINSPREYVLEGLTPVRKLNS